METKSPNGEYYSRSFIGLNKLIHLEPFNIGVSYWGWCNVDDFQDIKGVFFDTWLSNTLKESMHRSYNIEGLAKLLQTELRKVIPPMTDKELELSPDGNGGIHLCGFEGEGMGAQPSFWHIHNGKSQAKPDQVKNPKIVNAVNDLHPDEWSEIWWNNGFRDGTLLVYNGEIGPYKLFLQKYTEFLMDLASQEHIMPDFKNLTDRGRFWRKQVQFISELYESSINYITYSLPQSISKDVSLLVMERKSFHYEP